MNMMNIADKVILVPQKDQPTMTATLTGVTTITHDMTRHDLPTERALQPGTYLIMRLD